MLLMSIMFWFNACQIPEITNIDLKIEAKYLQIISLNPRLEGVDIDSSDDISVSFKQLSGRKLQTYYWEKYKSLSIQMPADIGKDEEFVFETTISKGVFKKSIRSTIFLKTQANEIIDLEVEEEYDEECDEKCQEEAREQDSDLKIIRTSINDLNIYESSNDEFVVKFESKSGAKLVFNEYTEFTLDTHDNSYYVTTFFSYDNINNQLSIK